MEKQPVSNFKRNIQSVLNITLLFTLSVWSGNLYAQKYFSGRQEYGVVLGASNYYGDLSQGQNIKHFHPSAGVYQRYNLSDYFAWRNQFSYLFASGTTDGNKNYEIQDLNFQTAIYEFSSMLSFDFHRFGTNINNQKSTPYALIGIGVFRFDPKRLDAENISLYASNTGMRSHNYSRIQMSVPVGIGYKYKISHKRHQGAWIIGVEALWRKTFTDYLDDVTGRYPDFKDMKDKYGEQSAQYSQPQVLNGLNPFPKGTFRGDEHLNDWYYFLGINLSYRITPLICR